MGGTFFFAGIDGCEYVFTRFNAFLDVMFLNGLMVASFIYKMII